MRHRLAGRHLGRDTAHRTSLYRNLVTDLLRYERITTTEAKAKEIRPIAERIITLGKRGDLHARRQALRVVYDDHVVRKVFDEIAERMRDRPGGYLRITGLETRKGDGAKMASIELVDLVDAPATPRPARATAAPARARSAAPGTSAVEAEPAASSTLLEAEAAAAEDAGEAAEEAIEDVENVVDEPVAEVDEAVAELDEASDAEAVEAAAAIESEAEADSPAEASTEEDGDEEK